MITGLIALPGLAEPQPVEDAAGSDASLEERVTRLEQQLTDTASTWQGFSFHGYMRAGFGTDGQGGPMEAFKAPNAGAKYRLGNEAETYLETAFRQALIPREGDANFATHDIWRTRSARARRVRSPTGRRPHRSRLVR